MRILNALLRSVLAMAVVCSFAATGQDKTAKPSPAQSAAPKYRNPGLPIEDRVADLLSRMTLEEKVQQICGGSRTEMEVDWSVPNCGGATIIACES